MTDKPEAGKVYALTGGPDSRCIANGNSWSESEVTSQPSHKPVRAQGWARPKMIKLQAARTGLTGHLIWDKIGQQQKEKYDSIKKSK
mgnify:CR=1 FL=1